MENIRRVAKDLEPYADVKIWKEESEVDEGNIAESDPMLQEAGHILIDQIGLASSSKQNQLVQLNNKKAS